VLLVPALAALASCVPDQSWRTGAGASTGCTKSLAVAVHALGRRGPSIEGPPDALGGRSVRIPVGESGDWLVWLAGAAGQPAALTRILDGEPLPSGLDGCAFLARDASIRTHGPMLGASASAADVSGHADQIGEPFDRGVVRFTDRVLRARLARTGALVVYVWSPHMPLSVDGYGEVERAARALGLSVEPVLFAGADRAFAQRAAERAGIPDRGLREVASAELILRDAQVHAPSILVFAHGRVSSVLPGYRSADGYRRFLEAFLN